MRILAILIILVHLMNCIGEKKFGISMFVPIIPLSSIVLQKSIRVGTPSGDTNEFGNKATIQVEMLSEPSSNVYICLTSSDTTNGGVILNSNSIIENSGICQNSNTYLEFTKDNWSTIQTFKVSGSRGTEGETGNTSYQIQIQVITEDLGYKNIQLSDIQLTNLDIDVTGSYFVRVFVSDLTGSIQLLNNNSDSLTVSENGYNNFPSAITNGSAYSVSIVSQSSNQVCAVSNLPYGTSSTNVVITINCVSGYLFNGTLLSSSNPPTLNQSFAGLVTLAGSFPPTVASGNVNGNGNVARFNNPIAITSDGKNLYVADLSNNAIRKIVIGTNIVSTLATVSSLPHGVATDGVNVYVSCYGSNTIKKIDISTGTVSALAGSTSGDLDGEGSSAKFNTPTYLTTDGTYLFVTDRGNNKIKKIVLSTGVVSTLISGLNSPNGIATDGTNLYIAESLNHRVLKYVLSSNTQSTIAGTGVSGNSDNSTGTLAQFNSPYGISMDGSYLYILEGTGKNLKKISLTSPNAVTTILGKNNGYNDGAIGVAKFCNTGANCDSSITFDGNYLYISDRFNNSIRKLYY